MSKARAENHLKAWRELRGLSQEQLAAGARTSKGQVSRLENGQRGLSLAWLGRLASALGITSDQLLRDPRNEPEARAPLARSVALIDSVRAGQWTEVVDPYPKGQGHETVGVDSRVGPRAFALRIEGDSMAPEFSEGDLIVVDPDASPRPGRYVVAKLADDERATFKKYRERSTGRAGQVAVELVPLNSDWPTLLLDKNNPGRIVGVAVRHYRNLP